VYSVIYYYLYILDGWEESNVAACSDRSVVSIGQSIKIHVPNSSPTPPVRRVKGM